MKLPIAILLLLCASLCQAQPAPWVSYPTANQTAYGVYHFRKTFALAAVPSRLVVHVSADNRYNLFVNGQRVCYGPAKGDLRTYKYDLVDLAPYLRPGDNTLAALVYNGGADRPLAFLSVQTAFMLRAEDTAFAHLQTGSSWRAWRNPAYEVISYQQMLFDDRWFYGFYACGGGDEVFGERYPWGWEQPGFDDSGWAAAEPLVFEKEAPWQLVPRNIPFMDNHPVYPARIRRVSGAPLAPGPWDGRRVLHIPARTRASVLVDFEVLTMGYPELTVSGGAGSRVQVKYAEALYEAVHLKAHRDSVHDLAMYGVWDVFHPDGAAGRTFRPLWKRCFRYVQFNVETGDAPLDIVSYISEYSGYPYPEPGTFESDDPRLNEIFAMSLRTLAMCSGETYYDTPFYEQLNYGGDNRPIAALSTYHSADDRLLREAMRLYAQSENPETGLLKSAYPAARTFWDMGSWSMAWVQSLHDYYQMRGDSAYVAQFGPHIERILGFFERHLDEETGLIGAVRNKNFIDWSITRGSLPRADDNQEMRQSALLTLYYAHTLDCAARLYRQLGRPGPALRWERMAQGIKVAVYARCWDEAAQLFRDYPDQPVFSQHTNIMAILCDVLPPARQADLLDRVLTYPDFEERASSYFSFFLFKAMEKTGQGHRFVEQLGFWHTFIERGHTTCGETGFASHDRSDCHAWSAHPAYFLLSIVCGIQPGEVGFRSVSVRPQLGDLQRVSASMPHPLGRIATTYTRDKKGWQVHIVLPPGLAGDFVWQGLSRSLTPGENTFRIGN